MKAWLAVSAVIDRISYAFGWIASWLVLASVLISAGNAMSRYLFSISSNAWLEIQWQLFSGVFLLGAPYMLCMNGHVRVDLFYGSAKPRTKLWIDVFGIIFFLFPVMLTLTYFAWRLLRAEPAVGGAVVQYRRADPLAGEGPDAARFRADAAAGRVGAGKADCRIARSGRPARRIREAPAVTGAR